MYDNEWQTGMSFTRCLNSALNFGRATNAYFNSLLLPHRINGGSAIIVSLDMRCAVACILIVFFVLISMCIFVMYLFQVLVENASIKCMMMTMNMTITQVSVANNLHTEHLAYGNLNWQTAKCQWKTETGWSSAYGLIISAIKLTIKLKT